MLGLAVGHGLFLTAERADLQSWREGALPVLEWSESDQCKSERAPHMKVAATLDNAISRHY